MSTQGSGGYVLYLRRTWRIARWALVILIVCYVAIVIYAYPQDAERHASEQMVAKIDAAKITEADVDGSRLPPAPSSDQVDATVDGIDANDNGIRDDVELAIFANYPTSTAIRSAELQYAMDEQMFLTDVFDQETWRAVAQQESRGSACIAETYPKDNLQQYVAVTSQRANEVESLVFNTDAREQARDAAYKYEMSYELSNAQPCDIDPIQGQ